MAIGGYSAGEARLRYDMENAPLGVKLLALTHGGVLVFANLTKAHLQFYVAWSHMPVRDKAEERRRGLFI